MSATVKVSKDGGKSLRFPLQQGKLSLQSLEDYFEGAIGVTCIDKDGEEVVLPKVDNMILPPEDSWEDQVYSVVIREQKPQISPSTAPSLTHVVMAPDRKLHTFEGREDSSIKSVTVEEFVSSMKNAFQRYNVPLDQRGQFLLDYLRAGPKIEVRSLLSGGKSAQDCLEYLQSSYGESLTSGELQRQFLQRRQRQGESIRQYAIDLERLFHRLQKKDPGLYKTPDTIIKEQFVDGIETEGLRHSCRDLLDRTSEISFCELKNWAVKRDEREHAHHQTTPRSASALQVQENSRDRVTCLEEQMKRILNKLDAITSHANVSFPSSGPQHWQGGPESPSPPRCYNCDQFGHFARNCPAPRRQPRNVFPTHPTPPQQSYPGQRFTQSRKNEMGN